MQEPKYPVLQQTGPQRLPHIYFGGEEGTLGLAAAEEAQSLPAGGTLGQR